LNNKYLSAAVSCLWPKEHGWHYIHQCEPDCRRDVFGLLPFLAPTFEPVKLEQAFRRRVPWAANHMHAIVI
jgi:hypothetical protein